MPMVREEYAEPESFARLLSSIDAAWIEEALEATGVATIRKRRLPAEQVVWPGLGKRYPRYPSRLCSQRKGNDA